MEDRGVGCWNIRSFLDICFLVRWFGIKYHSLGNFPPGWSKVKESVARIFGPF